MYWLVAAAVAIVVQPSPYSSVLPGCAWVWADPDGVGTGWIVNKERRLLITCRHVVGDRKTVEVFFPWRRDNAIVAERVEYLAAREELRARGLFVTGKVIRTANESDLALIELASLPPTVRALPLAVAPPKLGSPLWSVGNRDDLDTLWNLTAGWTRQRGRLSDGYFWQGQNLAANTPAILAQLPIEEGDSGGPIVNADGEVVGVVSAIRRRCPIAAIGPDVTAIRAFLERAPTPATSLKDEVRPGSVVWVRPTATDTRLAGVIIDVRRSWVLTAFSGLGPHDRVGVAFPLATKSGGVVGERDEYKDPTALHLTGAWRTGTVLVREPRLDLALIQLDSLPEGAAALPLAPADPSIGEKIHQLGHPTGVEFAWVYARGWVRQQGRIALGRNAAERVKVNMFQLPAQGNAAGAVLTNGAGELVGLSAGKEGPQQQIAYAANVGEVRAFLESVPRRTLMSTLDTLMDELGDQSRLIGWCWYLEADRAKLAGLPGEAAAALTRALAAHPGCQPARLQRAANSLQAGKADAAIDDLDALLTRSPIHAQALQLRAGAWLAKKEAKAARGDLEKLLDVEPAHAAAHRRLAMVHATIGENEKAASSMVRSLRLDPAGLPLAAKDAVEHAKTLAERSPDRAAAWLAASLSAITTTLPGGPKRDRALAGLAAARATPDTAMRLAKYYEAFEPLTRAD